VLDIPIQKLSGHPQVRSLPLGVTRVETPLGGWWTRPSNWKVNTAVAFAGIFAVTYGVWTVSAEKEVRVVLYNSLTDVLTCYCSIDTWNRCARYLL
jgi:hypothetical protein